MNAQPNAVIDLDRDIADLESDLVAARARLTFAAGPFRAIALEMFEELTTEYGMARARRARLLGEPAVRVVK